MQPETLNVIYGAAISIFVTLIANFFEIRRRRIEHIYERENTFDQYKISVLEEKFQEIEDYFIILAKQAYLVRNKIFNIENYTNKSITSEEAKNLFNEIDSYMPELALIVQKALIYNYGDDELLDLLSRFFQYKDLAENFLAKLDVLESENRAQEITELYIEFYLLSQNTENPEIILGKLIHKLDNLRTLAFQDIPLKQKRLHNIRNR